MRDLVIKKDWFPGLSQAPEELQKELFYRIIKYGCLEDEIEENENDNWILINTWNRVKDDIDRMKAAKDRQSECGKLFGKKNNADPELVWRYCQEHPGCKVDEIGAALDLPSSTAKKGPYSYLYENEGWKNRKNEGWLEKIPEKENLGEGILENSIEGIWNF